MKIIITGSSGFVGSYLVPLLQSHPDVELQLLDIQSGIDITKWDVSHVYNASNMFGNTAFNQEIGGWNVQNLYNASGMFEKCKSFNGDISQWNIRDLADAGGMFWDCTSFDQDLSHWNPGNDVVDGSGFYASSMFKGATNFKKTFKNSNREFKFYTESDEVYFHNMFEGTAVPCEDIVELINNSKTFPGADISEHPEILSKVKSTCGGE